MNGLTLSEIHVLNMGTADKELVEKAKKLAEAKAKAAKPEGEKPKKD